MSGENKQRKNVVIITSFEWATYSDADKEFIEIANQHLVNEPSVSGVLRIVEVNVEQSIGAIVKYMQTQSSDCRSISVTVSRDSVVSVA